MQNIYLNSGIPDGEPHPVLGNLLVCRKHVLHYYTSPLIAAATSIFIINNKINLMYCSNVTQVNHKVNVRDNRPHRMNLPSDLPNSSHQPCPLPPISPAHFLPSALPTSSHQPCPLPHISPAHFLPSALPTSSHQPCPLPHISPAHFLTSALPTSSHQPCPLRVSWYGGSRCQGGLM